MSDLLAIARKRYPGSVGERSAYRFIPLHEVEKPRAGALDCWIDHYWAVADDSVLLFRGFSPQCNSNRTLVERLCPKWAAVQLLPVAFLRHECES